MRAWIIGKHGLLARAMQKYLTIPYVATGKSEVDATSFQQVLTFALKEKPDWIINCSGYTAVDQAEDEREKAFLLNEHIPRILSNTNIPVLHFSTDYVFDGLKGKPYTEADSPHPLSVYGESKLAGEKYGDIVLRISWLFSDDGPDFVSKMKQFFKEGRNLTIVDDQYGRPTYAKDVVEAAEALMRGDHRGVFHFANAGKTSWYEFAKHLPGAANISPVSSDEYPQKAPRPKYSVFSTEKIEKTLQFKIQSWHNTAPCTEFLSQAALASSELLQ